MLPFILKNICKQTILQNHTYTNCSLSQRPLDYHNRRKRTKYHFKGSLKGQKHWVLEAFNKNVKVGNPS